MVNERLLADIERVEGLKKSLMIRAGNIILESGIEESPTDYDLQLQIPELGVIIHWWAITGKDLRYDSTNRVRVSRLVFENIRIGDERRARGNPALMFRDGNVTLDKGDIEKDEQEILNAIEAQIAQIESLPKKNQRRSLLGKAAEKIKGIGHKLNSN